MNIKGGKQRTVTSHHTIIGIYFQKCTNIIVYNIIQAYIYVLKVIFTQIFNIKMFLTKQ